jgi:hypothetical protein
MTTIRSFRPVFERVCADSGVTGDSKQAAWDACVSVSVDGTEYLDAYPVRLYQMLDRTRGPWRAQP